MHSCDTLTRDWTFVPSTPWSGAFVHRLKAQLTERRPPPRRLIMKAPDHRKRWVLYFMFLLDGEVTAAHRFTLERLAALDAGLFVICALPSPDTVPAVIFDYADAVVAKGLEGYDFSAYAIGLNMIVENSPGCDLFVMNDSVFGPFTDLGSEMDTALWRFTGYTAYSLIENHIQSYAFILKGVDQGMERALRPVLPRGFVYDRYKDVVFQQETRLARVASRGMSIGAKWYSHHRSNSEPAFFCALSLLKTGFPFLKKSLFRKMPGTYDPDAVAAVLEELRHPRP
ncbi:hypothetical protein ASG67_15530 [Sphingomonas sp. Leaf339]|nr:hypothetical protein ASG67_15530 [Sphingomonas sp. Leaf339]